MQIDHRYIGLKVPQTTTEAEEGDNALIAAPGAGKRIVVTDIVVQNESATATTVILKDGSTSRWRALLQSQGDALSLSFSPERYWKLAANSALSVNLSAANSHGVNVYYFIERDTGE